MLFNKRNIGGVGETVKAGQGSFVDKKNSVSKCEIKDNSLIISGISSAKSVRINIQGISAPFVTIVKPDGTWAIKIDLSQIPSDITYDVAFTLKQGKEIILKDQKLEIRKNPASGMGDQSSPLSVNPLQPPVNIEITRTVEDLFEKIEEDPLIQQSKDKQAMINYAKSYYLGLQNDLEITRDTVNKKINFYDYDSPNQNTDYSLNDFDVNSYKPATEIKQRALELLLRSIARVNNIGVDALFAPTSNTTQLVFNKELLPVATGDVNGLGSKLGSLLPDNVALLPDLVKGKLQIAFENNKYLVKVLNEKGEWQTRPGESDEQVDKLIEDIYQLYQKQLGLKIEASDQAAKRDIVFGKDNRLDNADLFGLLDLPSLDTLTKTLFQNDNFNYWLSRVVDPQTKRTLSSAEKEAFKGYLARVSLGLESQSAPIPMMGQKLMPIRGASGTVMLGREVIEDISKYFTEASRDADGLRVNRLLFIGSAVPGSKEKVFTEEYLDALESTTVDAQIATKSLSVETVGLIDTGTKVEKITNAETMIRKNKFYKKIFNNPLLALQIGLGQDPKQLDNRLSPFIVKRILDNSHSPVEAKQLKDILPLLEKKNVLLSMDLAWENAGEFAAADRPLVEAVIKIVKGNYFKVMERSVLRDYGPVKISTLLAENQGGDPTEPLTPVFLKNCQKKYNMPEAFRAVIDDNVKLLGGVSLDAVQKRWGDWLTGNGEEKIPAGKMRIEDGDCLEDIVIKMALCDLAAKLPEATPYDTLLAILRKNYPKYMVQSKLTTIDHSVIKDILKLPLLQQLNKKYISEFDLLRVDQSDIDLNSTTDRRASVVRGLLMHY
ncbi:MAG: hypothetical protein WC838_06805, partial [Candidatus Margulisiibacteriota bacterium]